MRIKLSDNLSIRKIENEVFILNRKNSQLHTFNGSGALLWEALQRESSSEVLADTLTEKYAIDRETAGKDVIEFIDRLRKVHLIEIV
jgi:16S rRNA G966 N2-methylase RsmD